MQDPGNVLYYTEGSEDPMAGLEALVPHVSTVVMKDCAVMTQAERFLGKRDEYGTAGVDVLVSETPPQP